MLLETFYYKLTESKWEYRTLYSEKLQNNIGMNTIQVWHGHVACTVEEVIRKEFWLDILTEWHICGATAIIEG
jgi:hypothetical protein